MTEEILVHYTIDGFGGLACSQSTNESGVWMVASEDRFDAVTCKDCRIGWLTYERDQYKEMFDNERATTIERERENALLAERYAQAVEENENYLAQWFGNWAIPYAPYKPPGIPLRNIFATPRRNSAGT